MAVSIRFFFLFSLQHLSSKAANCRDDEYDCDDQTCIKKELRCNGQVNCRFRWDEDEEKCRVSNCTESIDMTSLLTTGCCRSCGC